MNCSYCDHEMEVEEIDDSDPRWTPEPDVHQYYVCVNPECDNYDEPELKLPDSAY